MIESHVEQEELLELSIGKAPVIFQMPTIRDLAPPEEDFNAKKNPRFRGYSARRNVTEPENIDFPRPKHNRRKKEEQIKQSQLLTQISEDKDLSNRLNERIKTYDHMKHLKYEQLQQEHEEFYVKPWQMRVNKAMNNENYQKYLKIKEEMLENCDKNPVPIRSSLPPNKVPTIRVSRKGLSDPHTRYKERQKQEERLFKIINDAHGIETPLPQKPFEGKFDSGYYMRAKQTRFYTGRQTDAMQHGKRIFAQKYRDSINDNITTIKY
ncbi:hypothetical protein TVAG_186680 [Trichomonas vaginalis G3]|uniref:Uncharacterized protein n=1 Tax=Trichomonas vaginalis (strain ATCC PRA-98 / G3) TaxID=412133 RepID=A2FQA8_TRIV3|nr:hypothetical protein TVAGG3_0687430 [Trichomonas vaginalis G3]EAX92898.1 hypothetical protein TVAG_186680 [Trichomonas vaginalis G3]KAI5508319.1 hypothetical protein TVAGG3_0687430 [Trichomonas vaginalis G3]|eukprot:XP_001305828.1 hypothetical protein [Trichomonas vaginalis G3]